MSASREWSKGRRPQKTAPARPSSIKVGDLAKVSDSAFRFLPPGVKRSNTRVRATKEFRCPRAGEWYVYESLYGLVGAWAPWLLPAEYVIGELVEMESRLSPKIVRVIGAAPAGAKASSGSSADTTQDREGQRPRPDLHRSGHNTEHPGR